MLLRNKKTLLFSSALFISVEILLSLLIHKAHGDANRWVSYLSVVLACGFVILFAERSRIYLMTQIGLIMTVCADYFLIMLPKLEQFAAMVFFSVAQIAYFTRIILSTETKRERKVHVIFRIALSLISVILTFVILRQSADEVSVISMFYFANLVTNIIFAFAHFKNDYLFAIGLLLFACCDVLIGFSFLGNYLELSPGSLAYKLAHPGMNLAWVFYVPSQILIALSLLPERLKKIHTMRKKSNE